MRYELPTEPPEEPECTYICDACGNEIELGRRNHVRDGIIIACTNCSDGYDTRRFGRTRADQRRIF